MKLEVPSKRVAIVGGAAATVVLVGLAVYLASGVGRGCSSRDDVTARVAEVSARLQAAAAEGRMTVERLADGVKRVNAAATAYETSQDHAAYCESLDNLSEEFSAPD